MSSTPHDPFYSSPFGPFYRRHTPYMVQPEYRIYEMNKRLQSRTEESCITRARKKDFKNTTIIGDHY
ncbi:LDB2 protein, partial [Polypterus senegalus]|nr:LDB2 protein [Polypterus senegalus]